jgi:glycosyltransferase involved in cell wall biosynthesis
MSPRELDTNPQIQAPRVSIGLAVYNGEKYLEQAIQSILAQTFTDFELIISDNASTDRTAEICHKYAAQDVRIRYSRNPTNIGGANNENLSFTLSRGQYFRWAAHDDLLAPTLLEKCVEVLDRESSVVLSYPTNVIIDENGDTKGFIERKKAQSTSPYKRFRELTRLDHDCEETYGLIRAEALRATGLQRNYTDSDRTLLCHLALLGRFAHIPEPLFYKRVHPNMSTNQFPDWRQRMNWFDPNNSNRATMPHWIQFRHYLEIVSNSPISRIDKLFCFAHLGHWILRYRRWKDIIEEFGLVLRERFNNKDHDLEVQQ